MDPSEIQRFKSRVEVLEAKCERLDNDLADTRLLICTCTCMYHTLYLYMYMYNNTVQKYKSEL